MRAFDPDHRPQELAPVHTNLKRLFLAGTGGWLLALLVLGIAHLAGHWLDGRLAVVCLVGLILGGIGYAWAHLVQRHHPEL